MAVLLVENLTRREMAHIVSTHSNTQFTCSLFLLVDILHNAYYILSIRGPDTKTVNVHLIVVAEPHNPLTSFFSSQLPAETLSSPPLSLETERATGPMYINTYPGVMQRGMTDRV